MLSIPELKTQKCFMTEMKRQDTSILQSIIDDELTHLYLPELGRVDAQRLLDFFTYYREIDEGILWAIRNMDMILVGFIAIMDISTYPTLFYAMHPSFRGLGMMKEAVKEVTRYASTVMCGCLFSEVMPVNAVSQHILKSLGFRLKNNARPKVSQLTYVYDLQS